jgi:hypothetical protein
MKPGEEYSCVMEPMEEFELKSEVVRLVIKNPTFDALAFVAANFDILPPGTKPDRTIEL